MANQDHTARPTLIGLGEVLWDLLPEGKQFGGAPANFAYHAKALGAEAPLVITRDLFPQGSMGSGVRGA